MSGNRDLETFDLKLAKLELKAKADVNKKLTENPAYFKAYMFTAIKENEFEAAKFFLELVDFNSLDGKSLHPYLVDAVKYTNLEFINLLLEYNYFKRADIINMMDGQGEIALHSACKNGHYEIADALIKGGADKNIKDKAGHLPKDYVCVNNSRISDMLLITTCAVNLLGLMLSSSSYNSSHYTLLTASSSIGLITSFGLQQNGKFPSGWKKMPGLAASAINLVIACKSNNIVVGLLSAVCCARYAGEAYQLYSDNALVSGIM